MHPVVQARSRCTSPRYRASCSALYRARRNKCVIHVNDTPLSISHVPVCAGGSSRQRGSRGASSVPHLRSAQHTSIPRPCQLVRSNGPNVTGYLIPPQVYKRTYGNGHGLATAAPTRTGAAPVLVLARVHPTAVMTLEIINFGTVLTSSWYGTATLPPPPPRIGLARARRVRYACLGTASAGQREPVCEVKDLRHSSACAAGIPLAPATRLV